MSSSDEASLVRLLTVDQDTELDSMSSKVPAVHEDSTVGAAYSVDGHPDSDESVLPVNGVQEVVDPTYRVYKRRFFGLLQLVLLNIIVSWDVR